MLADGVAKRIGTPFRNYWRDEDRAAVERSITIALERGRSRCEARDQLSGGWVEITVTRRLDDRARPVELLATLSDVTGNEALLEDYRALFDAVPAGIWVSHDPKADFLLGNPACERRVGFVPGGNQSLSQPSERRHDVYRYFRDDVEVPADSLPAQRAARGEHVDEEEYELRLQDGTSRQVVLSAAPMRNARSDIIGCVTIETDVTVKKRYEKAQSLLLSCSATTGQEFFDRMAKAIGDTLKVRLVYVSEIVGSQRHKLRVRSAYVDGHHTACEDYIPRASPCLDVMNGASLSITTGLAEKYPASEFVKRFGLDSIIGRPLRSFDGEIIGIIELMHDRPLDDKQHPAEIVDLFASRAAAELQRLRSESSLRATEEKSRIIMDVTPSLVSFIDCDMRYQFVNAAYERWFGQHPDELKGELLAEALPPLTYQVIRPHILRALKGERVSYEAHLPDIDRHIHAEYVPQTSEDGTVLGIFAFVNDVSERKAHEEALSRSAAQFRTLFQHLPVGVAMVDQFGRVLIENEVFTRLIPAPAGAVSSDLKIFDRDCALFTSQETALAAPAHPVKQALRGVLVSDVELLCRARDRDPTWVRMSAIPIMNPEGRPSEVLVVVADVDRAKRDESQRTLLINELNHRVKNTLASVQSIAAQTFRSSQLTKDALPAFEERLMALSDAHNLLTLEHWSGADLKRVVALVLEPHASSFDRLHVSGPSVRLKPPAALAFTMALHELATNAVKYGALSTIAGSVTLHWEVVPQGHDMKRLKLAWKEHGGPPVILPVRKGFGTKLIERSLAFETGSETSVSFRPQGVVCEIDVDLKEVTD